MSASFSLGIQASRCQTFDQSVAAPSEGVSLSYYEALSAQFGVPCEAARLAAGRNNDFFSMASAVLSPLAAGGGVADCGYLLMAHQTPDTHYPVQSLTSLLCQRYALDVPAFALTEQADVAPYIAVHMLARLMLGSPKLGAALLLILDQASVPWAGFEESIDAAVAIKLCQPAAHLPRLDVAHVYCGAHAGSDGALADKLQSFLAAMESGLSGLTVFANGASAALLRKQLPGLQLSGVDPRYMSCAGWLEIVQAMQQGLSAPTLLAHLTPDGHLYSCLFRPATSLPDEDQA